MGFYHAPTRVMSPRILALVPLSASPQPSDTHLPSQLCSVIPDSPDTQEEKGWVGLAHSVSTEQQKPTTLARLYGLDTKLSFTFLRAAFACKFPCALSTHLHWSPCSPAWSGLHPPPSTSHLPPIMLHFACQTSHSTLYVIHSLVGSTGSCDLSLHPS